MYDSKWHGYSFSKFSESTHNKGMSILFYKKWSHKAINLHRLTDSRIHEY